MEQTAQGTVEPPSLEVLQSRVSVAPGDVASGGLGRAGLVLEGFSTLNDSVTRGTGW